MRVAWVIYGALDQATGGYIYDRLVIERLRARGDEVRVIELDPAPRSRLFSAVELAARAARAGPDVIVGDELCHKELAVTFPLLRRRVPRALLVHHLRAWELPSGARREIITLVERAAVRASDAVLATSRATADRLRRELNVDHADIAEPGADRLEVRPRLIRADSDRLQLVFVGSLIPRKRVLELLSALERARALDTRLELSLIGDPSRDPAYAARVRSFALASPFLRERVHFKNLVSDAELAGALAEADALVLPSALEGYGMVLTEAIRAGVPVLAARVGAAGEVVRGDAEARLFDTQSELVDLLRRFAGDADLRASMRAAAEARAPSLPTWDAAADAVRASLSRAIVTARRP